MSGKNHNFVLGPTKNVRMKKLITIACAAMFAVTAQVSAQTPLAYKLDNPELPAANPYTVVKVKVVVEKETIRKGPYARFAQKYLGATAPLNDKDIYAIKSAALSYSDPGTAAKPAGGVAARDKGRELGFPKVSVDRLSPADRGLEDAARDAANMIYTIRKRRFELVSGELGENAFGGGMKAALKELDRMEREYMALFFGKTSKTTEVRNFEVIPQKDKTNYIVCRFSESTGLMPETDLSATPVVLSLSPEKTVQPVPVAKNAKGLEYYRVADFVQCTVTGPSGELAKSRIPVYQFGETVAVAK